LPKTCASLVVNEDERFFEHSGIDGRGTLRAFASLELVVEQVL
jgi:penicillin-binding protein 1A